MVGNAGHSEREEFRGARIQVLGTEPDNPEEGRIFVWTKMGWFERLEGPSGDVAFTAVADSEEELREWILQDNAEAELFELHGEDKKRVAEEFRDQSQSDADSPDADSSEESNEEPLDGDDQEYHQHDL